MQLQIYLALFLLTLGHFLVDFMIGILPVYKTIAELDIAKAGLIAGLCAFIGEGVQVIFGPLGDKGYRKTLIICGILGTAAATFFSYTQDYYLIFALYMATCLGSGAFHPSAASILSTLTSTRKALFIGIFAAGGAFGIATSQIIFSSTYMLLEGHTMVLALPSICLILFMTRYLLSTPPTATLSSRERTSLFKEFFKNRDLRNLYFASLCNQSVLWGVIFLMPDALRAKGYSEWVYLGGGHLFFILGAGFMLIPGGILADKYSPRIVLISSILVGGVTLYAFLFTPVMPLAAIGGLLFTSGAALGMVNPVSVAFGNKLLPAHPGIVNACLMGLVWCIAEGLGQTGGGILTGLFIEEAPVKALMIVGCLSLPALFSAIALPQNVSDEKTIEIA